MRRRESREKEYHHAHVTAGIIDHVRRQDPEQHEFHQAVTEFMTSVDKIVDDIPDIVFDKVLERLVEPERVVMFGFPGWMMTEPSRSTGDTECR